MTFQREEIMAHSAKAARQNHVMPRPEQDWRPSRYSPEEDPRPVEYFSLDLTLDDIDPPGACPYCSGDRQKEFLPYETTSPSLILNATPTPGYGCTDCGMKVFPHSISIQLHRTAACHIRQSGDSSHAEKLERDARALENTSSATAPRP